MRTREKERGSALVLALLVVAVLTVLGLSFSLLAQTENRIAETERLASQTLYLSEAAARAVVHWFDAPNAATGFSYPGSAAVDRTLRRIDEDGDPATLAHDQDGATWPRYKQGVDRDGDGEDDLFDRPYRPDRKDAFLGTEDGPDVRIDGESAGPGRDFLESFSEALMAGHPGAGTGISARVGRIDIYAPPYLPIGGTWIRHGIATVRVIGRIHRRATDEVLAERTVEAIVAEIPYSTPFGPLHSCGDLSVPGTFGVHWGAVTASGEARLDADHVRIPASLPRVVPPGSLVDLLWGHDDAVGFAAYRAAAEGMRIEDPWLRVLAGRALTPAPSGDVQPFPFPWTPGTPLEAGEIPAHEAGDDGSHSNLFQGLPFVECPGLDYALWKSIATSGRPGVEYYAWESGDMFRRDGVGPARSFREITDLDPARSDRRPAVFFFDTRDGAPPRDDDVDGVFDNLTPGVVVEGGVWSSSGLIYTNAESLRLAPVTGRPGSLHPPGEPFADPDRDGLWDPGEDWINLRYPAVLGGDVLAEAADGLQDDGTSGGAPVRNGRGRALAADVAMDGILYTSGRLDSSGAAIHHGSFVAREGVVASDPSASGLQIYWDERIRLGGWPPGDWGLPRVTVTRWR